MREGTTVDVVLEAIVQAKRRYNSATHATLHVLVTYAAYQELRGDPSSMAFLPFSPVRVQTLAGYPLYRTADLDVPFKIVWGV